MEIGDLREDLQTFFSDGLVIVVGSGLSCAEGLPSMAQLGETLQSIFADHASKNIKDEWAHIASDVTNMGLEPALFKHSISNELEDLITRGVAQTIRTAEENVVQQLLADGRHLRLQSLLPKIMLPTKGLPIITTNYDRLVEIACESSGLEIDNMFVGNAMGQLDRKAANERLVQKYTLSGRIVRPVF